MEITNFFERKLLFSAGRHLSNIFSVVGLMTVLTGGFLFISSINIETAIKVESFSEEVRNELEILKKEWENKMSKFSYSRYYNDPQWATAHDKQKKELDAKYEELFKKEGIEYERYTREVRYKNARKRTYLSISPFLLSYGFIAIASAAATSAVFSIERNTRKN